MPRLSFRSATPALVCMGLIAGMVATTGSALPAANTVDTTSTTSSVATAETEAISAPLSAITDNGSDTLADARAAVADAREVTVDIRTSGLEIASDSTIVPTSELSDFIVKLEALDVTPTLLIPALTSDADAAIASVREGTAALRGQLDAAIEKKKAEEAAAKAAAEAKKKAEEEAAAAAAAAEAQKKAEEEAAAAAAAETSRAAAAPSVNVNVDPASAQGIARSMAAANYGWGDDQFACLVSLWNKESGWNAAAYNASSGAYGIPQALPGSKMASAGADWQTNPATQIAWGMGYIAGRYGNPCGAWGHSQSTGWY